MAGRLARAMLLICMKILNRNRILEDEVRANKILNFKS